MPRYFIGTFIYFWIPCIVLWVLLRNKIDIPTKKAFWITLAILTPLTFIMEYVYLWADIWNFTEEVDPLLGIEIFGAPVEEFSFWFGAGPFILLLYFSFDRLFKMKRKSHAASR
ncbi:MAG: hypothetical protein ACKVQC_10675 [Elusimicrobiota bacterium]